MSDGRQGELEFPSDDHADESTGDTPTFTRIMGVLDLLNKSAEDTNRILSDLIAELNTPDTTPEPEQKENPVMKELTAEAIDTLKNATVDGNVVKLPPQQLNRQTYLEVKNKLELIGGKWKGGKVSGFVFQENPSQLLSQIASGQNRNLKKEFQFFGTPDSLSDRLVSLAEILDWHIILEPSAGQGSIVKAIHRAFPEKNVNYCELMPINNTIMQRMSGVTFVCEDFLTHDVSGYYDRIIANPPFTKNQDIDHIRKMFTCLKSGGRLVSIASTHWRHSSNKKEKAFKSWLKEIGAREIDVPAGEFKESGTSIATVIIVIDKPLTP